MVSLSWVWDRCGEKKHANRKTKTACYVAVGRQGETRNAGTAPENRSAGCTAVENHSSRRARRVKSGDRTLVGRQRGDGWQMERALSGEGDGGLIRRVSTGSTAPDHRC